MEPGIHTARMEVLPVPLVAAHCTLRPVKAEARATMGARMEVLRAAIVLVACVVWKSLRGRVREWRRGEARTDLSYKYKFAESQCDDEGPAKKKPGGEVCSYTGLVDRFGFRFFFGLKRRTFSMKCEQNCFEREDPLHFGAWRALSNTRVTEGLMTPNSSLPPVSP